MRRFLGIAVVAMLGLVGVPSVAAAVSTGSDAMTRVVVKPLGISLQYPSTWIVAKLTKKELAAQVDALTTTDPAVAAQLAQTDLKTAKFRAIDNAASVGDVLSNVRVQQVNSPAPRNLAAFTREVTQSYEADGDTVLGTKGVKVRGTTAYRVDLTVPITTSGTTPTIARISQLAIPRGSKAALVTVAAPDTDAGGALIDSILGSVRAA